MCHHKQISQTESNKKDYQEFFGIEKEQYLLYYTIDEDAGTGYIVFIDNENDLDYVDKRDKSDWGSAEIQAFQRSLGKLQQAEATPHINLKHNQILAFKQILGRGYLQILEKDFTEVDAIIQEALQYLKQRNIEASRELFLSGSCFIAVPTAIAGFVMYLFHYRNIWIFGVLFGILGAFVSIWTRYGKEEMTGLASKSLHYMESISRLFVGALAAVVVMLAIRCGLILSIEANGNLFFIYCVFGFAAGFSERLLPSFIERIINYEK